jgi:hypothetical protein
MCLALDNRHGQTIGCLVSLRSFVSREQVVPQPRVLSIPFAAIVEKNHSTFTTHHSVFFDLKIPKVCWAF